MLPWGEKMYENGHIARKRETTWIKVKEKKQQGEPKRKWQQIYTNIHMVGKKVTPL